MTVQEPSKFYPRLSELLLECGIVLVALPNLKNANINGATKRFKNGSVMLLISDRNKNSDIFWFSIMHEISHILDSDFYSDYKDYDDYWAKESKANEFAGDFFIDNESYKDFIKQNNLSKIAIINFADSLDIHPSILVGKLQNDKEIPFSYFHDLKIRYSVKLNLQ